MGNEKSTEQQTLATGDDGPKQECGKCPVHCPHILKQISVSFHRFKRYRPYTKYADIRTDDQDTNGQESQNQADNEKENRIPIPAYVLLKDDKLESFIDYLLKGIGLKLTHICWDNLQTLDENDKRKFDDETTPIILVRHGSTRLDSDITGCLKYIADSDMERTVIVIINEFDKNKKGKHGEIIRPNNHGMSNLNDIKSVVTINYKCCYTKTRCRSCNNALKEIKKQLISPNYK